MTHLLFYLRMSNAGTAAKHSVHKLSSVAVKLFMGLIGISEYSRNFNKLKINASKYLHRIEIKDKN